MLPPGTLGSAVDGRGWLLLPGLAATFGATAGAGRVAALAVAEPTFGAALAGPMGAAMALGAGCAVAAGLAAGRCAAALAAAGIGTGGLPVDATAIPMLLGASAGLRALVNRRRRNG